MEVFVNFLYFAILALKFRLIFKSNINSIGDEKTDMFIIVLPSVILVSEWAMTGGDLDSGRVLDVIMNHRPVVHIFDQISQLFLIVRIFYNLYKSNDLFNYLKFLKLHLQLSYSVFC